MTDHVCDPSTSPGGGAVTQARALRLLIAMLNSDDIERVVLDQTGGCAHCSATLFFGLAGMSLGTIVGAHGPNALMVLELQLAGAEADIKGSHGA